VQKSSSKAHKDLSTAKVAWIYQDASNRADWLAKYFLSQKLNVQEFPLDELTETRIFEHELIVIEAMEDCTSVQTKSLITLVRSLTLKPIQVLTVDHTGEQVAELLQLGADDVQTTMTDSRVVLAHARALMRRWLGLR
jgi:DNA-binding response OmpR family regulator